MGEKRIQRIEAWIERLEDQAERLIDGANLDELSAKERIDLAAKLLAVKQKYILLAQQAEASMPGNKTEVYLQAIMRQMRSPVPAGIVSVGAGEDVEEGMGPKGSRPASASSLLTPTNDVREPCKPS